MRRWRPLRTRRVRSKPASAVRFTVIASGLAVLALSTTAGASTGSPNARLLLEGAPSASTVLEGADTAAKKKKRKKPRLGLLPSKNRIDPIKPAPGANGVTLPASVDLRTWAVPVGNQGNLGSCVSWAINYAMLGWYSRHDGKAGQPFHPMYTYSQIHVKEPPGGSYPEDALKVAKNQGTDTMAHYNPPSHSTADFTHQPSAAERANAGKWRITGFHALFDRGAPGGTAGEAMIQTELAEGRPVAIGMKVLSAFQNMYNKTSLADATYGDTTSSFLGYHEVLALGYDPKGLLIQNSWGQEWGFKGYARLTWPVVEQMVTSAYVIDGGFAKDTGPTDTTDTTPPTMGAVSQQFPLDNVITNTTEPVAFGWTASDRSGIAAYAIYVKTDGKPYAYQGTVGPNATRYTLALAFGHTYQIAVAAKDNADNWSSYSYSAKVAPSIVDDKAIGISSPWTRFTSGAAFGGTYVGASEAGAWVKKPFIGTDIALIGVKASNAGRATIYCDGNATATGDFYSAVVATRQIVAYCHFEKSGQHSIEIVNEGTAGRPSLYVDAFAILQ